jgi:hypothetical protein
MYDNLCIIFECQDLIVSLPMIKSKNVFNNDYIAKILPSFGPLCLCLTSLLFWTLFLCILFFCPFYLSCGLFFSVVFSLVFSFWNPV